MVFLDQSMKQHKATHNSCHTWALQNISTSAVRWIGRSTPKMPTKSSVHPWCFTKLDKLRVFEIFREVWCFHASPPNDLNRPPSAPRYISWCRWWVGHTLQGLEPKWPLFWLEFGPSFRGLLKPQNSVFKQLPGIYRSRFWCKKFPKFKRVFDGICFFVTRVTSYKLLAWDTNYFGVQFWSKLLELDALILSNLNAYVPELRSPNPPEKGLL